MIEPPTTTHPWPLPLRRLLVEGRQALRRGDRRRAADCFTEALRREANLPEAHLGLALAQRPGPDYLDWLRRLHQTLRPRLYLEIGVETGRSLRLASAAAHAVGIDPAAHPPPELPLPSTTRLIARTSADFFNDPDAVTELPGPVDFAFIDGDHRFASVLHDFIALEAHAAPGAVIALHDTWPLDPLTATQARRTGFYTGDAWKVVPCLRAIRPDLRLLTLPTAPTGLTLITALCPDSIVLRDRFEVILAAYAALPYGPIIANHLALARNDWSALDQLMGWRATATAK
ncbi:class I SAM-dependent methyltransferase [Magnetospirillum molischianum]|uniref:Class I SAM-dependent methyltransferase n=1 Tax=Magnetospirillum molischianum DSM 120 TaxID=1150626 RepID=H8FS20_MAGML|nr:class I SAM-dependent methyltransferase [Magnetospirillum molischianum]CCG41158.1 conserved hypothetical protein [Magnetospirillum molischianum DSM 120]